MTIPAQPLTLAQKLIARASGRARVVPGEFVTCRVDLAMFHDSGGPRRFGPMLAELGAPIWDRDRVVLVIDHYVPEADEDARRTVRIARDWAREHALPHVHDGIGISHVVLPRHGHLRPGMLGVGGDSHACTAGAFGVYMLGIGSTEMLGVLVSGEIWVQVPQTLFMRWSGRLALGVTAKDMMLAMIGRFGVNVGHRHAIEYCGEAVSALPIDERMTLANMSAELGAQVGLIAPDDETRTWLWQAGVGDVEIEPWHSDEDAPGVRHNFDASTLAPQITLPHKPAHARDVADIEPTTIQVAHIGGCTGAKLEDLRAAARVLAGYRVDPRVRLLVAPASVHDRGIAEREGVLRRLQEAGAQILPAACGLCAGHGDAVPEGSTVISSIARHFKGRLGPDSVQVFLASPYTVAASALRGRITDPREVLWDTEAESAR
ncbi:MAG TPA: aconitase/3-isopropylmalate dehydratase large subunit family protein [Burkholderiaceae bacterium]|nr:aconitase/3-isopropylmalate dehydratase large subunit family protein [Burkholderiaceae bacterium]